METPTHGLRRELKLRDLVLMQVILIVSLTWTGFAAKQGATQVTLWLFAILLFYIPLAATVMKLSRAMPAEGGVYQWVRQGISPFAGYMAGWSLTIFSVSFFASAGSTLATGFAFAGGPGAAWMGTSKPFALALTAAGCLLAFAVNVRGLHLSKWISGLGSILTIAVFFVMLYLLGRAWIAAPAQHAGLSLAWPALSLVTLNVFTKMALSALSGFDQCAVFSEECRRPENDVARSVVIAAPLIAVMYIFGTGSILAYIAPAKVDLAAPVSQVIEAGFGIAGAGRLLTQIAVTAFNIAYLSAMVVYVGMISRLPMVAGWDGLLPAWWSELHPRFRTPWKAIGAVSVTVMCLGMLSLWGADNQEASQVTAAVGIGSYCLMYLLLAGAVLFGFGNRNLKFGVSIRVGAASVFLVALLSLFFEVLPLGDVANPLVFALKVAGSILLAQAFGAFLYRSGARRSLLTERSKDESSGRFET
jgi:amino acid transporter